MGKISHVVFLALVVSLLLQTLATAGDLDSERQVQHDLLLSKAFILKIAVRQQAGEAVSSEIAQLKALAGSIAANHRLLRERFAAR
ncbi:MAG: hypothetical protein HGA96_09970, partial [Desulfobulbaceae bacterium]|nr:hypothetical protein [Desulfobulbaceae bacterium]